MNFIDKYKEELEDEELMDIEEDEVYEMSFDEFLDAATPSIRQKVVTERVNLFIEMDKALREAGYEDKDERLRIIEIIM